MKKWIFGIGIFLFLLSACTLSSTQEQALNKQMGEYIDAVNGDLTLYVVARTYPAYVKHVKNQGVSQFKSTFGRDSHKAPLGSTSIKTIEKDEKQIHVLFQAKEMDEFGRYSIKKLFVAISENDGKDWFFIPYEAYRKKEICPGLKRLV